MHVCTCASLEAPREHQHEASEVKNVMENNTYPWAGGGGGGGGGGGAVRGG